MSNIIPFLWYSKKAEEAAAFYASIIPNSKVNSVTALPVDSPSGPAGSVKVVDFTLNGQPFMAMTAGPLDDFNHSVSFMIECEDQEEIDRLWDALGEGGTYEQCGWLRDRYGLCWQIVPKVWKRDDAGQGPGEARSVYAEAMMKMVKFDIAALQKAVNG